MTIELPDVLSPLQTQLLDAAERFATDAQPLSELLTALVRDVERAAAEPLEIFPVCHHSPASALQIVQRLRQKPLRAIYMELCEDLQVAVEHLRDCKLPVALQAFAAESETFPAKMMPLCVVAPLTEASAEYQAIAYALEHPQTELVFVDRATDFAYQWQPEEFGETDMKEEETEAPPSEEAKMHGTAIGVEMGSMVPTFDQFLGFLLQNSNTRHFAEWWDQYIEQAIIGADYSTYRQVMFLIGSLFRRLGSRPEEIETDRLREQYMWTRIKHHMAANQIAPQEAIYICGAAHSASDVAEFGVMNDTVWEIPERTQTTWLYGLIPSSFAAIEYQFNHPAGTASLAEKTWKKSLKVAKLKPFSLKKTSQTAKSSKTKSASKRRTTAAATASAPAPDSAPGSIASSALTQELAGFLARPPDLAAADTEQLLQWCTDIVALARKNGYLSSTADAIAIYQTSALLANMRDRLHPTPYDFQDAAITCLEKDRTPKKRTILQLCQLLLGGDRVGTVGYASLPPLAQNVYDRLAPLKVNLLAKTNQRALMDFKQQPQLLPCSDVLWRLNRLVGGQLVQPIMGERTLGHKPVQESWEIRIGKHQRTLIMLGYEGVTIEQVLAQRLNQAAFDTKARASHALEAAEDSILYLYSPRLTQDLGKQALALLKQETSAEDAPQIFERVRRLVHYYRTTPEGLPAWIEDFVATGYSHYATLLPQAFADRGTTPEQIAGMLGFIFTLESLALALGCDRSQLQIGIQQASQEAEDPAKLGLLWTTEWLLNLRTLEQIRDFFDRVLANPMLIGTFPDYLGGFILSLTFAPRISRFLVELLSKLFASAPDAVLLPSLPNIILRLRTYSQSLPALFKEAAASFPNSLAELDQWQAPWDQNTADDATGIIAVKPKADEDLDRSLNDRELQIRRLLFNYQDTTAAMAQQFGIDSPLWTIDPATINSSTGNGDTLSEAESQIQALLQANPATMTALSTVLFRKE